MGEFGCVDQVEGLPKLKNDYACSYTVKFKDKSGEWVFGKTFSELDECVKEQRALEKYGEVKESVIIKFEVRTTQSYVWGC